MKRFWTILFIGIGLLAVLCGCQKITDEDLESSEQTISIDTNTDENVRYVINEASTIESDLEYFGLAWNAPETSLALSDICAIFPDGETFYFYFKMPVDTKYNSYRVDSLIADNWEYQPTLLEVNGTYQKYKIDNFRLTDDNSYEISRIKFYNEKKAEDIQTYDKPQTCIVISDGDSVYFHQENYYHITLEGILFESVYQFNKNKNGFQTIWNNIISSTEGLDTDKRSFFYFAFNCYDTDRDIYFVPDDVLQLDVEYNQLSYQYEGKDKAQAENIEPTVKKKSETIKPTTKKVVSDSKYSNKKIYQYDTINKLTNVDLSKNVDNANAEVLALAAKKYDWAVQFGNEDGYPYKKTEAGYLGKTYDYEYTHIENFKSIKIVYQYEGKTFDLKTNSLIAEQTTTVQEKLENPTAEEKEEYEKEIVRQDSDKNWLEKTWDIFWIGKNRWKHVLGLVLVAIGFVIGWKFYGILRKAHIFEKSADSEECDAEENEKQ